MTIEDISDGVHLVPLDDDDIDNIVHALAAYLGRVSSTGFRAELEELIERLKEIRENGDSD